MRIAQLLNNRLHWIFEAYEILTYPPDPEGNPIILIDITDLPNAKEQDGYNPITKKVVHMPSAGYFPTKEGFFTTVLWDNEKYEFYADYVAISQDESIEDSDINDILQAEILLNQMELKESVSAIEQGNAEILLMLAEGGLL